jgi:16S rRNA (cytosine1402-N4)-methyltransferase
VADELSAMPHTPALLKEVIDFLNPSPGEFFIDGTINGGGHAREILEQIPGGTFLGCEWDKDIFDNLSGAHLQEKYTAKIILKNDNYAHIPQILKKEKLPKADGLLLDLGFSSIQLENLKGMSFQESHEGDFLDMRYERNTERQTAAQALSSLSGDELTRIFRDYGEERYARKIAEQIVSMRRKNKILTVGDLVEVVKSAMGTGYERGRIHPATRVFQALRIYVNEELQNLESILKDLPKVLKPGGRVAIISFHSLEDRIVKNHFRDMKQKKMLTVLTPKPIISSPEEISNNPRARSAKLRATRIT